MRRLGPLLFVLLITAQLKAQWGFSAAFRINNSDGWVLEDPNLSGDGDFDIPGNGPSLSVDYEIRLQNVRIVFLPEANAAYYRKEGPDRSVSEAFAFSLFMHGQFYFLDFYGDCDCPTFSKRGTLLQKGLFFPVSPGLSFLDNKVEVPFQGNDPQGRDPVRLKKGQLAFSIGAGLGLDIGLSELFTLTPGLEARYFPSLSWEGLSDAWTEANAPYRLRQEDNAMWQVAFSIRAGFRLDL